MAFCGAITKQAPTDSEGRAEK